MAGSVGLVSPAAASSEESGRASRGHGRKRRSTRPYNGPYSGEDLDRIGFPIIRQGWKTVEQVAAELQAKYPEPIVSQLSSIELIRQNRDSR